MKVLFSSWQNHVIDNRGVSIEQWQDAQVGLPPLFDPGTRIRAFMGWAGIILVDDAAFIVPLCRSYMVQATRESCGQCVPCRTGTRLMAALLEGLADHGGTDADLSRLEALAREIMASAKCSIGKTSPVPILHALRYFREAFLSPSPEPPHIRYEGKATAPCLASCPTGMNVPAYIEQIRGLQYTDALATIREASPLAASLGRSCFHHCENNCRRSLVDNPISICKLKRFAWDYADSHALAKAAPKQAPPRKEKVAVIGAGPAGLSAAYYLALTGYPVTVFEALPVPGGMMGVGIPEYRIPKAVLQRDTDAITDLGVEIRYDTPIGKDLTLPMLKEEGYQAVFIATGAHLSKRLGIAGEDAGYEGFCRGISYLKDAVLTRSVDMKGKRVIVLGGGNVAMDCCRSPLRQGAARVTVVYRRTKAELPADPQEVRDSEAEGVEYTFLTAPVRIVAENGRVTGLECLKMVLGEPDRSGRRLPVPVEGSEFVIPADIIIQAIGQDCDLSVLRDLEGVQVTARQTIVTDPQTLQTHVPWIFAGGDVMSAPLTLVDACGNGRRAAQGIHQYLSGVPVDLSPSQKLDAVFKALGVFSKDESAFALPDCSRVPMPTLPEEDRIKTFAEVELGYSVDQAVLEASRCMRCYQVGVVALTQAA